MTASAGAGTPPKPRLLAVVSSIGPPVTVISSVLVFFGWIKADAEAKYMGLNVSLFGYTTQDYVFFSLSSLSIALIFLFVVGISCMVLDRWLVRRMKDPGARPRIRRLAGAAIIVGILVAGAALLLVALQPGRGSLYAPYVITAGVLLTAWAGRLYGLARAGEPVARSIEQRVGQGALLFGLVALLLFWAAADHAQDVGRRMAMDIEQHVDALPRAELYSARPLAIDSQAVTEATLGTEAAPVYRYDGLRLLAVSGGNLFFLHDGWTAQNGSVVVLPNDNSVRIEYGR
jgi:hypothetical protein